MRPHLCHDAFQVGVVSKATLENERRMPKPGRASLDSRGRLLVGAAVGTREGDKERVAALVAAGVDVVILDSSQGSLLSTTSFLQVPGIRCDCITSESASQKVGARDGT